MEIREKSRTRDLICLLLAFVTAAVYARAAGFGFVNYDDPDYVTENPHVLGGLSFKNIFWAFRHFHASNWHPLTWISHMLDCQLFGLHAGGHHLVNVSLHAANAVLLFLLLERLTRAQWRSAMVAALFALHPLHVESVAWIAERKDVLSVFFGLLALHAYARYAEQSDGHGRKSWKWHAAAFGGFALSLMAKPMMVTLPFVMLLLDFWPLKRMENAGVRSFFTLKFRRLIFEKAPWFLLSAGSCVLTFLAQKKGGSVISATSLPFQARIANAVVAYCDYLLKAVWPVRLAVFYPMHHTLDVWRAGACAFFLVVVTFAAVADAKRWPFFFVGWFWFLGTLVPVIGLVQVGEQAMADRYTYISLTGIFIAAVWGISEWIKGKRTAQLAGAVAMAGVLATFGALTFLQLGYWRNSVALFQHALAVTRDNALANNNLGTALAALGDAKGALDHYREAVRIDADNAHFQNNLAAALARDGQRDGAFEHYQAAIYDDPRFAKAYSNLGALLLEEHRVPEAITNLNAALSIEPLNGDARNNLANAFSMAGDFSDALVQYAEAARLDPTNGAIHLNEGLALTRLGRIDEAMAQFSEAVRLNPASAEARFELGRQLAGRGAFPEAIEQLEMAVKLKPNYAAAEFYLSAAQAEVGRLEEAIESGNRALQMAQATGQTNLAVKIESAIRLYKSREAGIPNKQPGD